MPAQTLQPGMSILVLTVGAGTGNVKGSGFSIPPSPNGQPRSLSWQILPVGGPSALSMELDIAQNDTDAEYKSIDTSTNTSGELKIVNNLAGRWIRAQQVSRTGGTDVTVQITIT